MNLNILYRGPLSSCNYGCSYCPFAKHKETPAEHKRDNQALQRFINWVKEQKSYQLGIFFTPWGEALHLRRYQEAFITLSHLPQVQKVTIQTNLSCSLKWVEQCQKERVALWTTFHPTEISRAKFVQKVQEAVQRGLALSVGVVGLAEHAEEITALREELPAGVYLWINAYKREPDYYPADLIAHYTTIDPLFPFNNTRHPSHGRVCHTGETVFSVDGEGVMRRCHFVREVIGNIYEPHWAQALQPRPCPNATCGCHIGYVHMPELGLQQVFGAGILERIPKTRMTFAAGRDEGCKKG